MATRETGAGSGESSLVYVDTAGIESFVLTDQPATRLGHGIVATAEGLYIVVGAALLDDGQIVVANKGTFELRFYDAAGILVSHLGREGNGPGEFKNMRTLSRISGDTIVVWDPSLSRLTYVIDGNSVREQQIAREVRLEGRHVVGTLTIMVAPNGLIVAQEGVLRATEVDQNGLLRDTIALVVYDRAGNVKSRITSLPGMEYLYLNGTGAARPFGHVAQFAVGRSTLFFGTGKPGVVERFDYGGLRKPSLAIPVRARPASRDEYKAAVESFVARIAEGNARVRVHDALMAFDPPEMLPAYRALLVDQVDRLWIKLFHLPWNDTQEWLVVAADSAVARVRLPSDYELLDAGEGEVMLLVRGDLGAEEVRRYRLVRLDD